MGTGFRGVQALVVSAETSDIDVTEGQFPAAVGNAVDDGLSDDGFRDLPVPVLVNIN